MINPITTVAVGLLLVPEGLSLVLSDADVPDSVVSLPCVPGGEASGEALVVEGLVVEAVGAEAVGVGDNTSLAGAWNSTMPSTGCPSSDETR
ncbi:MAG: hypothetical protein ABWX96_10655 [Propionibacteriaceae bacterium]